MNSQEMMEEIDRLARLCEAKDDEINQANSSMLEAWSCARLAEQKLSEVKAQIAMQAEALKEIATFPRYRMPADIAKEAISSTSETVAAWRAKEKAKWNEESNSLIGQQDVTIESLRDEIAELQMQLDCEKNRVCSEIVVLCAAGNDFIEKSNQSIPMVDIQAAEDKLRSVINNHQATALAYEREVKAKEQGIAFECAARIIEGRLRDEPRDINHEIRKCAAAVRDKGWQIKFLADYEELRASKGE